MELAIVSQMEHSSAVVAQIPAVSRDKDDAPSITERHLQPSVFTADVQRCLAESNAAARALRDMHYRVIAEDPIPNDDGRPILLLDLNGQSAERLLNQCHASTRLSETGQVTAHFMNVRVIFQEKR